MPQAVADNNRPSFESGTAYLAERVLPYYDSRIKPYVLKGETILIAAYGNSLRALVMQLEQLTREQVLELNIPTGAPLLYELDASGKVLSHRYL